MVKPPIFTIIKYIFYWSLNIHQNVLKEIRNIYVKNLLSTILIRNVI